MCVVAVFVAAVSALIEEYPEVEVTVACIDKELSDKGFIVPGLGDAGDRQYRTSKKEEAEAGGRGTLGGNGEAAGAKKRKTA